MTSRPSYPATPSRNRWGLIFPLAPNRPRFATLQAIVSFSQFSCPNPATLSHSPELIRTRHCTSSLHLLAYGRPSCPSLTVRVPLFASSIYLCICHVLYQPLCTSANTPSGQWCRHVNHQQRTPVYVCHLNSREQSMASRSVGNQSGISTWSACSPY
ncbi:unnamed protein product [Periconia digitata]|uniref:Uncharacterized protein n=1 Tax=Periconia digitata TaxID=1303443 RepID=A0A9W4XVX1_9PLEO|nr:unnamed protein product [Periconia digitata]